MTKTTSTKLSDIKRQWHIVDLEGQTLGRVSTSIAKLLAGKDKTYYSPNLDCGDYVIVVNAAKVHVSGKKRTDKLYRHHTGHPGGFREYTFAQVQSKDPKKIITQAVKGMLPKNKLRSPRLKRLKVFESSSHPYQDKFTTKKEK